MNKLISAMFLSLILLIQPVFAASMQQLLQLIDYIGVDYAAAVQQGEVISAVEYKEMLDFAEGVKQQLNDLPANPGKVKLVAQGAQLAQLIRDKAAAEDIKQLTAEMRNHIISVYQIRVIPKSQPDMRLAATLYQNHCASCHGVSGAGDGEAARGMEPPPVNFKDIARYRERTLYGLYNTISQGVEGTSMPAFSRLTEDQRWSLAFYVGSLAGNVPLQVKKEDIQHSPLLEVETLTTITPAQAVQRYGKQGGIDMAILRAHPQWAFDKQSKLVFAKQKLTQVLHSYQQGQHKQAYQYAVEAYLDGYEMMEQALDTLDHALRLEIENAMTLLRSQIRTGAAVDDVQRQIALISNKLDQAAALLENRNLSAEAAFTSALLILLREGLEAILIVAALIAFLVRTQRRDALRYIHFGWAGALVLGVFTWWASVELIDISGASREITEGIGAMIATIVLLYVGFWMHEKTSAVKWQQFIDKNMQKALSANTLWALSGLSFIAVYREVFETILFYQALWTQTDHSGQEMVLGGMLVASVVLGVVAWLVTRFSVRLPLRQFFSATSGLMFVLAFIFAGKGIAALQEAGWVIHTPLNGMPRIDILGIYPNLQGIGVQLLLLILMVFLWKKQR